MAIGRKSAVGEAVTGRTSAVIMIMVMAMVIIIITTITVMVKVITMGVTMIITNGNGEVVVAAGGREGLHSSNTVGLYDMGGERPSGRCGRDFNVMLVHSLQQFARESRIKIGNRSL
jgi:hypothetical protein